MFVRGCLYPGCLTLVLGTLSIQQMAPWAAVGPRAVFTENVGSVRNISPVFSVSQ